MASPTSQESLFQATNRTFLPFLRSSPVLLIVFFLICECFQQYFATMMRLPPELAGEIDPFIIKVTAAFGSLSASLLLYVFLGLLIPQRVMELDLGLPKGSFWVFSSKHAWPLTVEGIRALALVILWSFVFIIPGVFKYIRYSLMPYVVVVDSEYEAGRRDPLKYSNDLVKGITWPLFFLFVIMAILDYLWGEARNRHPLPEAPVQALASAALFFMIVVYANVLLFRLYQLRVKGLAASTPSAVTPPAEGAPSA